jgi:hypothetical protein
MNRIDGILGTSLLSLQASASMSDFCQLFSILDRLYRLSGLEDYCFSRRCF